MVFVEESTPDEWVTRGDEFFRRNLFDVAMKCYSNGGDTHKEKKALAYKLAFEALRSQAESDKKGHLYLRTAVIFIEINAISEAAWCLVKAKEYKLAAQLFEKLGKVISKYMSALIK